MSELKRHHINEVMDMHNLTRGKMGYSFVYYVDDVDKYIAELKKERDWLAKDRAQAYDDLEKRAQLNIKQEESIRHQKYKRCLAMWLYLRECYWRCKNHNEQTRANWYNKWMNVFQKLAEKFKEAK